MNQTTARCASVGRTALSTSVGAAYTFQDRLARATGVTTKLAVRQLLTISLTDKKIGDNE